VSEIAKNETTNTTEIEIDPLLVKPPTIDLIYGIFNIFMLIWGQRIYAWYYTSYKNNNTLCPTTSNGTTVWTTSLCLSANPIAGYTSLATYMMSSYLFLSVFWTLNFFKGNNGNAIHKYFNLILKITSLPVPIGTGYYLNVANNQYGTTSQVTTSSAVGGDGKYLLSITSDTKYGSAFVLTYFATFIQFLMNILAVFRLNNFYQIKVGKGCINCSLRSPDAPNANG
jgi:hypothetical protein